MAPPVVVLTGPETSLQNTDNNVREMEFNVYDLEPDAAPLTALMNKMGSKDAGNPKVEWLENEAMPRITTLSASASAGATIYGVAADIFRAGDVLRLTTQNLGLLVTATAAGAITAAAIGAQTSVSASSGSEVFLVSSAVAEGSVLREIKYPQLVTSSNYCQIVRTEWGVTGTEEATEHYGGNERARLQKFNGIEHARKLEQMFFFGPRSITGSQRTCGGLIEFIATFVTADTGGLLESEWQTFLQSAFRFGSSSKVAFCSPRALSVIEGYARANLRVVNDNAARYGVKMTTYESGQGTIGLVKHPDWRDSTTYNGYVVVVDMDAVKERPLRPNKLRQNVQTPAYDGYQDEFLAETTLQVIHERRHALLTGVT